MLNGLFLWCFQVTSPWKQISGQVELMKEPETQKGLQRSYSPSGKLSPDLKKRIKITAERVPDLFPGMMCLLKTL